tara:strand:- start:34 stop:417 length:384 start_codon:yes stop_codon:yes gene_type:complete
MSEERTGKTIKEALLSHAGPYAQVCRALASPLEDGEVLRPGQFLMKAYPAIRSASLDQEEGWKEEMGKRIPDIARIVDAEFGADVERLWEEANKPMDRPGKGKKFWFELEPERRDPITKPPTRYGND